jgi:putative SOS response-associated peptidase YedK
MSGRFFVDADPDAVAATFAVARPEMFPGRYNIAPGQPVAIVRMAHGVRDLALVRWGLIPSWVRDPRKYGPFINARAEGIGAGGRRGRGGGLIMRGILVWVEMAA